jgi:hypothetical protein
MEMGIIMIMKEVTKAVSVRVQTLGKYLMLTTIFKTNAMFDYPTTLTS